MQAGSVVSIEQAAREKGHKGQGARRSASQWAKVIEAQCRSDLTVVEFCRRRGIAKATFWYWRKRLVAMHKQYRVAKPAPKFLAVPIVTPVAERIEVDLGTMRVRLDGAGAARVVDALVARVKAGAWQ